MRGRKPKPTAQKLLRGNPGQRKINAREPKPRGVAQAPRKLRPRELEIWNRLISELGACGVATSADSLALARLAELESLAEQAKSHIDGDGMVDDEGNRNAYVAIYRDLSAQLLRLYSEFGMTAAARSRVSAAAPEKSGGIEDFLGGS